MISTFGTILLTRLYPITLPPPASHPTNQLLSLVTSWFIKPTSPGPLDHIMGGVIILHFVATFMDIVIDDLPTVPASSVRLALSSGHRFHFRHCLRCCGCAKLSQMSLEPDSLKSHACQLVAYNILAGLEENYSDTKAAETQGEYDNFLGRTVETLEDVAQRISAWAWPPNSAECRDWGQRRASGGVPCICVAMISYF